MIKFDIQQIEGLMQSFYTVTGIRFVLFDADFQQVISYPKEDCRFCRLMKSNPKTRRKCQYADRRSFEKCVQSNSLAVYKCHAGLVEAVIPLHENEKIVGYLMFGQISDDSDKKQLIEKIAYWNEKFGLPTQELEQAIGSIADKTTEEIHAAAKIMEACTSYIVYKELITLENDRLFELAKTYIEDNLGEDIRIATLCSQLLIGRTKLYELFRKETGMGIAEYIKKRRLHRAKKLLKTTDMTVPEVASAVGFADYNYFSRSFKNAYGKSPKKFEKR